MPVKLTPKQAAAIAAVAAAFIAVHEGLPLNPDGTAKPYLDAAGIPTICYGQTGPTATSGARMTPQDCKALLEREIAKKYLPGVLACVDRPLTLPQAVALTSFAYNVGVRAACYSTLVRYHNAGDCPRAAAQFARWTRAGGRILPGLVTRREDEAAAYKWGCE